MSPLLKDCVSWSVVWHKPMGNRVTMPIALITDEFGDLNREIAWKGRGAKHRWDCLNEV